MNGEMTSAPNRPEASEVDAIDASARVAVRIGNYNIEVDALQRWYDTARFDEHFPGALMAAIEEMLEPGFVPLTESNPDYHPLTTLDDLPTDELEALYELTGIQRADQTSPELHRARKWLSDAVYERHHGPIKRIGVPVPGELQVFTGSIGGERQTDEANDFVTPSPRKAAHKPNGVQA